MESKPWREHSVESDWEAAAFLPYPAARGAGELLGLGAWHPLGAMAAMLGLQWVEQSEIWLSASRRMTDNWREAVRGQQDAFLVSLRDQLCRDASHAPAQQERKALRSAARRKEAPGAARQAA